MSRQIPFTAHVFQGIILEQPRLFYIKCPVISLGVKEFRGFDINYCIIKTNAYAIEYRKNLLANKYFNDELWRAYMSLMCGCCNDLSFANDTEFLIMNGITAPVNNDGLML